MLCYWAHHSTVRWWWQRRTKKNMAQVIKHKVDAVEAHAVSVVLLPLLLFMIRPGRLRASVLRDLICHKAAASLQIFFHHHHPRLHCLERHVPLQWCISAGWFAQLDCWREGERTGVEQGHWHRLPYGFCINISLGAEKIYQFG